MMLRHLPVLRSAPPTLRMLGAMLGLLAGLAGLAGRPAMAAPPRVATVAVRPAQGVTALDLDGSLQAQRQATVAAQIGGNVLALLVKPGDTVKAGQVLARIDERDSAAGLSRTDAGVSQAQAELRNARVAAERNRELRAKGFVSQAALDVAETQLQAAQAGLAQASGARSQAALARGFAAVTAPFDGVVQATQLEAGDLASPGRPVLTLYAPGAMRAVVQVPATRAAEARSASRVEVQTGDGRWLTPLRRSELPATDPVAQTVEWRLDLPAAAGLSPGQSVQVRFTGPASGASQPATAVLSLPQTAVLQRGELTAVYLVQAGRFQLRSVRLGRRQGDQVAVLAGLAEGDRVAVDALAAGMAQATPAP